MTDELNLVLAYVPEGDTVPFPLAQAIERDEHAAEQLRLDFVGVEAYPFDE